MPTWARVFNALKPPARVSSKSMITITKLSKNYGGIHALTNVSLHVAKGKVHSICGENGAGKSTLIKILAGATPKSSGVLEIDKQVVHRLSPKRSMQLGIAVVYQEFSLIEDLSIAENIYLSDIHAYSRNMFVNDTRMLIDCTALLQRLHMHFNPKLRVSRLSTAEKQLIEIAKALSKNAKILILDEPTAVLSVSETKTLFELLLELKSKGVTILYVSHRLQEVLHLSDSISVFRNGMCVASGAKKTFSEETIIKHMLDKKRTKDHKHKAALPSKKTEVLMRGENIRSRTGVKGANFVVHKGEVVGIAGIVGSGRTELSRVLFGIDAMTGGRLEYKGAHLRIKNARHAMQLGIALVPESRKDHGCIIDMSVRANIVLPQQGSFLRASFFVDEKKEIAYTQSSIKKFQIKSTHGDAVKNASGGNQQKVVLAKWMSMNPTLLILDEPTRGIDVGAKDEVYAFIRDYSAGGGSVILISSELFELRLLSDRIYVMNKGVLSPQLEGDEIDEVTIMKYALGVL